MEDTDLSQRPDITLPFRIRRYDGRVRVYYGVNRDAAYWGFDALQLPFDISSTHGFPVCQAEIDFEGAGYNAVMGWIQVVTVEESAPTSRTWASVDTYPMLSESDNPFVDFGYLPTMFDAPGPNPPRRNERWIAETFLTICPNVARSRRAQPVLGFRWGYDLREGLATPFPLETASAADWQRCVEVLRERYPNWEFDSSFAAC